MSAALDGGPVAEAIPHPGFDHLALVVDAAGVLTGTSFSGVLQDAVTVRCDGVHWATVPTVPIPGSAGRSFVCDLPDSAVYGAAQLDVSVDDLFGDDLASIRIPAPAVRVNGSGLAAADVLRIHDRPFHGVPYWSFDGASVTIGGSYLPPCGDPSALSVEFGPGVAYRFEYPFESSWQAHFWYWPNARFSDFRLVVDLAASDPGSDPFTFRFKHGRGPGCDLPEPYGRIWIPRDLASVVGLPRDVGQLTRVQTWSDARSVTFTGYNHYRAIRALLDRHDVKLSGTTLMDWGCGHGRVARHFVREWPEARIVGMDVDAGNIAWAKENIPDGDFVTSPLMPPCPLQDSCLDAMFSISVMTHLEAHVQRAWLAELARLMRPGGLALMSFGGPAAVAWSSRWNGPAYLAKWKADGIHDDQPDDALAGGISDSGYYRNAAQTHEHVRRTWSEHFHVVEIIPEAIGNLDVAVLRRR